MFNLLGDRCGCGKPATNSGYFCDDCRAAMFAAPPLPDVRSFDRLSAQHELAAKLNKLSDNEWRRFTLCRNAFAPAIKNGWSAIRPNPQG